MNPSSSPSASIPVFKDVVLIGGGHANVHVIKMLGAVRPLPGVRVTVVTKDLMTPYSGMIPAYVAGQYEFLT
jgi:selenide,water dikinase